MPAAPHRKSRLRRYTARFYYHNGNLDTHGNPTLTDANDWLARGGTWPCEMTTTAGGERIRGRQVTAATSHVLFGEQFGMNQVKPSDRCYVNGEWFNVVAAYDMDGMEREGRVELRREQ